jgi:hypothetical protein
MKTSLRVLAAVFILLFFGVAKFAVAGGNAADWTSAIVQQSLQITVGADKSLVIRNLTQDLGTVRGFVSVTTGMFTVDHVITAAIIDPALPEGFLEPISDIVIAGPSTVTVTAGDAPCFITYRKIDD